LDVAELINVPLNKPRELDYFSQRNELNALMELITGQK
jgi:hypothetical protein